MQTTKKDFELFKKECQKWIDRFELSNWNVYFYHGNDEDKQIVAQIYTELTKRSVAVNLNTEIDENIVLNIPEIAKHEMIHLLLADIIELGWRRFVTKDELESAEESLVSKLVKIIPTDLGRKL